jgi:hypothetical protein
MKRKPVPERQSIDNRKAENEKADLISLGAYLAARRGK